MNATNQSAPKLEAPGAGLPFIQRFFLRAWIGPITSKRVPPQETKTRYEAITKKIIELSSNLTPAERSRKILIAPMAGLEDSSRYWSISETLEHLLIVSKSVEKVILSLSAGKIPDGKADVAKVKPGAATYDQLEEFASFAPSLVEKIDLALKENGMNFKSELCYEHPWFGPFKARQWYWLLSVHQGIHYQQIKAIIRGLKEKA